MTSRSDMRRIIVLMLVAYVIGFLKYAALLNDSKQRTKEASQFHTYFYCIPCRIYSSALLCPPTFSLNCNNTKKGKQRINKTYEVILKDSKEFDKSEFFLIVLFLFLIKKASLVHNTNVTKDEIKRKTLVNALDQEVKDFVLSKKSYWSAPYRSIFNFSRKKQASMFSQYFVYPVFNMSRLASYSPVLPVETTMSFILLSEAGFRYRPQENDMVCDGCMKSHRLTLTGGTMPSNALYHNHGCGYIVPEVLPNYEYNSTTAGTYQSNNNILSASGESKVRSVESSVVVPIEECPAIGGISDDSTSAVVPSVHLARSRRNSRPTSILSTVNSGDGSQSFPPPSAGVTMGAASTETTSVDNDFSEDADTHDFSPQRNRSITTRFGSALTLRVWENSDREDQSQNRPTDFQCRPYFDTINRSVSIATRVPLTVSQIDRRLDQRISAEEDIENLARRHTSADTVDYNTSNGRTISFLLGPVHLRRWAGDLANQGIFYTGRQSIARCCNCNSSWSLDLCDDVFRTLENHPRSCMNLSHNSQM